MPQNNSHELYAIKPFDMPKTIKLLKKAVLSISNRIFAN